ncbi:hypothetical protein [Halothiobacillus sp. DCM-1]|uniref:hypothetical protein n=1 Tax=Halothiobacillus sp. DCM-1 TaxID=3112558 RepID=UPI00324AF53F
MKINQSIWVVALFCGVMGGANAADSLYSMKALMDAKVVAAGNSATVGEVENVIVDQGMTIAGLVIEMDHGVGDVGGRSLYVERGKFWVQTEREGSLDKVRYLVHLNEPISEARQYPQADETWWQSAKGAAAAVWHKTKSTAGSAWDETKAVTGRALDATKDATKNVLDSIREKMQ